MTELIGASRSGRRRRSTSKNATGIKSPRFGRNLLWGVVSASLLVGAYTAHQMRLASHLFGTLYAGATSEEVLYLRGSPAIRSEDQTLWTYSEGAGAHSVLRFSADNTLKSITCTGSADAPESCPDVMGVVLGTPEDRLINRLGPPDSSRFVPNGKVISYGDLGVAFSMREYRVQSITKVRRGGRFAYLPRVLWHLLP